MRRVQFSDKYVDEIAGEVTILIELVGGLAAFAGACVRVATLPIIGVLLWTLADLANAPIGFIPGRQRGRGAVPGSGRSETGGGRYLVEQAQRVRPVGSGGCEAAAVRIK